MFPNLKSTLMKRNALYILTFIATLAFTGCSKHHDNKPAKPKCKIITETGGPDNYSFTYNSDGKVQTIAWATFTTTFTYSGHTAVATTRNISGAFQDKKTITLNGSGMTTNVRLDEDVSGKYWENFAYVYQGSQLIKTTVTFSPALGGSTITTTYTWSGGNPVSETVSQGGSVATYTNEFYTGKPSKQGGYLRFKDLSEGIKTMLPKNLIKSSSGNSYIENYSYHFDSDGKVTDFKRVISSGNTRTYNLQYQCK